jgi:flagellar basal-body rod modification protein FlgD
MIQSTAPTSAANSALANPETAVAPGGKLGKNEFLQLLVTQLRNQDPMNPMDGQRMAADLAQFTGLEQLVNIGQQLDAAHTQGSSTLMAMNNVVAISTMGKNVTAIGDQVELSGNGGEQVTAKIAAKGTATLHIYNSAGAEVGSRPLGTVSDGTTTFDVGAAGQGLKGAYTYKIDVTDSAGKAVDVTTYMTGRVDGVSYDATGAFLTAGKLNIPIGAVVKVQP